MVNAKRSYLARYFLLSYLIFWILLGITGVLIALKAPSGVTSVMKNVCAWAPTFVILIQFRRFYPETTFVAYLKRHFLSRVSPVAFLLIFAVQLLFTAVAVTAYLVISGNGVRSIAFIGLPSVLPMILINATSGPMGEELGWRGFALTRLQETRTPFASALVVGVLWGFWHLPLWVLSGYTGLELLAYVVSFMVAIISLSVVMTVTYNKQKNILIAMWIHFLFNFLLAFTNLIAVGFIACTATCYLVLALVLAAGDRKALFLAPSSPPGSRASLPRAAT